MVAEKQIKQEIVSKLLLNWPASTLNVSIIMIVASATMSIVLFQSDKSIKEQSTLFYLMMIIIAISATVGFATAIHIYTRRIKLKALADAERIALEKMQDKDFESFERVRMLREQKAKHDFERNLGSKIIIQQLEAQNLVLFPTVKWRFQPGVNILLGRNGYGKSLLLRTLAAVVQHEEEVLKLLLRDEGKATPFVEVHLTRNGEHVSIRRDFQRFIQSVGKIPLLAIPDSRFLDRSQDTVGPDDSETSDLRISGAQHFLYQRPYGSIIRALLYEICLDYWDNNKRLDLPVFKFLNECVKRLTGYEFQVHSIERRGRTGFEIRVLTEGNEQPLPIQYASQGTLSVLAICGLIRSYLRSLSPDKDDGMVQKGSGIVLIDEADAHLHPAWQQKFPSLLRDLFPNVQFILSAHSPLFVAGCWGGEVAVLRRDGIRRQSKEARFVVEQLDYDFVGATAEELYRKVFEIEELDDTYLKYATKATLPQTQDARINEFLDSKEKGRISPTEEEELWRLEEEARHISRAVEVKEKRNEQIEKDLKIEQLQARIIELECSLEATGKGENVK